MTMPLRRRAAATALALALIATAGCTSTPPGSSIGASPSHVPSRSASPGQTSPANAAPSPAAAWLADQFVDLSHNLYVYRDFNDGANGYTQKAWMGSGTKATPMAEDATGIGGSTGIKAGISLKPTAWGGYLFLSGALAPGSSKPQLDFGSSGPGLDLSGASRLTFWAKGAKGGERVEFFLGGLGREQTAAHPDSTSERRLVGVRLSQQWTQYSIDLTGADLSSVTIGFGWVANGTSNPGADSLTFWLDSIRYEFPQARAVPQLLASYAPGAPGSDQAIINGFAYTYDNAVAALALLRAGKNDEARSIGDAFVFALDHDRTYDDGRLRNAYANGDPRSLPAWLSSRGERFAKLPGFWDDDQEQWFEDYYADSTATGNLAWAILALVALHDAVPTDGYLRAAQRIGQFVLTLQRPKGGFAGGYEGFDGKQTKASYLSTEHNIDLIAAFAELASRSSGEQARRFDAAARSARDFVESMRNADGGFWTGTKPDGLTPNTDVTPLDTNTWAVLALGDGLEDPQRTMAYAEARMAVGAGYDFDSDRDGIWNEGSAQAALAYAALGDTAKAASILAALNDRAEADGSITAADRDGLSTGFTVAGTDEPWLYDRRVHVGATAWLAFAQQGYNPLAAGQQVG